MSQPRPSTLPHLLKAIDSAWKDLTAFIRALPPSDASKPDKNNWTVKDHVTHITVWEDSVAVLFRGGLRHDALGIDERFYTAASFDQINEVIKERYQTLPLAQAIQQLEHVHDELMARVSALSETDLKTTVRDFFPQAPRTDDRTMMTFLYDNTADHFTEHLEWMVDLTGRAA